MRHCAVAALILAAGSLAAAQTVVVPNEWEAVEGPTNNSFPFTTTVASQRFQQVHGANQFTSLSGPHRITALRLRPNANSTYPAWTISFPSIDIRFSTTSAAPDQLNPAFDANVGLDEVVVHNGPLTISTMQSSGSPFPVGPMEFDIEIPFQTPFIYDPANGNLLMDVRRDAAGTATTRPLDAVSVIGDGGSRLFVNASTAATGTADSVCLVVQFVVEPVSGACYPNCDGSTIEPILNVADFSCFLSKFAAGDPYANCDGSTTEPVLNVQDFSCFLGKFAAGCR
jgi:hypothetical protein